MEFTKMHGLGNDYIYINCLKEKIEQPAEFAKIMSDRNFGIGSDGLILIEKSEVADFKMLMFNADGSMGKMCGNGIRCVGKYVFDYGLTGKTDLSIETSSGLRQLKLYVRNQSVFCVCVNMGAPRYNAHSIPILSEKDMVIQEPIDIGGKEYRMTGISMGNPHAVVQVEDVWNFPVAEVGRPFELHPRFPERINTEFCQIVDRKRIHMRVWERGAGETKACGTGACAAVVASVLNGLTDEEVTVTLLGGELNVRWDRSVNCVFMTGPAVRVYDGIL